MMSERIKKIAALNDEFRHSYNVFNRDIQTLEGQGYFLSSNAIFELDIVSYMKVYYGVWGFEDFPDEQDNPNEHNQGRFYVAEIKRDVVWSIDYYDEDYRYPSKDPSNPNKTRRVLTMMLD